MTIRITILGLEKIGASIGLALIPYTEKFQRVGFDRNTETREKAIQQNIVDQTPNNIIDAVNDSDIVILALPCDEIKETIEIIAPGLKSGVVLLDTSPIKIPVLNWTNPLLLNGQYFISFQPTINPKYLNENQNGIEFSHADLFENSLFLISTGSNTRSEAIQVAVDLAGFLKSRVLFADPYELDGINAATELLPRIIANIYVQSVMNQPGWSEGQKIAGTTFKEFKNISVNHLEREYFGSTILLNKDNTIRLINNFITTLTDVKSMIEKNEEESIITLFKQGNQSAELWDEKRINQNWDKLETQFEPTKTSNLLNRLFSFGKRKK